MKRTKRWSGWSLVVAAILAVTMSSAARAQGASPIAFGVFGGASIPVGDLADGTSTGYHVGGLVQWDMPAWPIGVRVDAAYHRFSEKGGGDAKFNIIPVTANLTWNFPMDAGSTIRPYLIAGVGYYHASCSNCGGGDNSDNKFGVNGGIGATVPLSGFSVFGEARFHNIFTDNSSTRMVPVSVGVIFHP